jgi:acetyl esterase
MQDASPLRAASLAGLAPVVMILAEHDILREDGEEYIRRLEAAGVPVQYIVTKGSFTALLAFPGS